MDFWVFVAAAGAGCFTKYLKNTTNDREMPSYLCSGKRDAESQNQPFRRPAWGKKLARDASNSMESLESLSRESLDTSAAEEASRSRAYHPESKGNSEECNLLSISTLPTEMSDSRTYRGNENENERDAGRSACSGLNDLLAGPSEGNIVTYRGFAKNKNLHRSKYTQGRLIKPLSSLESCLLAQLYHHAEMEDYWHSSPQSPTCPTVRPLLVTDGSRIISRLSDGSYGAQSARELDKLQKKAKSEKNRSVVGVPLLPELASSHFRKQMQGKSGKDKRLGSSITMFTGKRLSSEHGTHLSHDSDDWICYIFLALSVPRFV